MILFDTLFGVWWLDLIDLACLVVAVWFSGLVGCLLALDFAWLLVLWCCVVDWFVWVSNWCVIGFAWLVGFVWFG